MRVLHLIDAHSSQASSSTLALLAESYDRLGHIDQHAVLLGGAALTDAAQAAGLKNITTLGVPLGQPLLGWVAIKKHTRTLGPIDLVHCWSLPTLAIAALQMRSTPRVLTLTIPPNPKQAHWLRVISREARGPTVVLPISSTIRRATLAGGAREDAVHLLRPGISMSRVDPSARNRLRKQWGAEQDTTHVIALLSDPPHAADTFHAAMALCMARDSAAHPTGKLKLLTHPDQKNRLRAQTMHRYLGIHDAIIQEPRLAQPWDVLPGCDAALAIGPHAGGLSLLWATAAGIPVIGEATYAVSEIIEDRHSCLLAQPNSAKTIALRVSQLLGNPQLAWQLQDTARHETYSFFSRQRYCQSLRTVYEQITSGANIEIPEMEATGGLRFAGRA